MACTELVVNTAQRLLEERQESTKRQSTAARKVTPESMMGSGHALWTQTFGVFILLCLLLGGFGGPCLTTLVCVCLAQSFTTSAHDLTTVERKRR